MIAKDAPIENRFSGTDFIFGSSATKSQTVYYFIGENGLLCEVGIVTYNRTKVGDVSRCDWKSK